MAAYGFGEEGARQIGRQGMDWLYGKPQEAA